MATSNTLDFDILSPNSPMKTPKYPRSVSLPYHKFSTTPPRVAMHTTPKPSNQSNPIRPAPPPSDTLPIHQSPLLPGILVRLSRIEFPIQKRHLLLLLERESLSLGRLEGPPRLRFRHPVRRRS